MRTVTLPALAAGVLLSACAASWTAGGSWAAETAGMKIMPDGGDMQWQAAPDTLPKGMMITLLSGDPSKPGPSRCA